MVETPSRPGWGRVVTMLALVAGFYALALAVVLGLSGLAYLAIQELGARGVPLASLAGLGGLLVLRSFFLVPDRFEPPGPRVTAETDPELVALVEEVARAVGAEPPDEIYLSADVNAYAGEVGRVRPRRRVLILGMGLIDVETVGQLRAAVAHELAHFKSRDTRLTGFLHRTRQRLARTAAHLDGNLLDRPFSLYARLFVRASRRLSRAQELAADRVAVEVAGRRAHIGGLRAVEDALVAFHLFQAQVLTVVLAAGVWPENLFEGFRRFRQALSGPTEIASAAPGDDDDAPSHPSTDERVRFAEGLEDPGVLEDERPARVLLRDAEACEREISARAGELLWKGPKLAPLSWDELPSRVLRPRLLAAAEEAREEVRSLFGEESAGSFADATRALLEMLARSAPADESPPRRGPAEAELAEVLRARVETTLAVLLGATLLLRGGEVTSGVGERVSVAVDGQVWDVERVASEAARDPRRAAETLEALGLGA